MNILITFVSTTDAFYAEKTFKNIFKETQINFKLLNIPYKISKSCHGIGLKIGLKNINIKEFIRVLQNNKILFKKIWIEKGVDFEEYKMD